MSAVAIMATWLHLEDTEQLKSPVGCEAGFRRKCCFDNLFGKLLGLDTAGDDNSVHPLHRTKAFAIQPGWLHTGYKCSVLCSARKPSLSRWTSGRTGCQLRRLSTSSEPEVRCFFASNPSRDHRSIPFYGQGCIS